MTCIVGLVHDGDVFIGGDSAGSNDAFDMMIRADEKVFKKDGMVFGFTSSFRMGQILRYSFIPPSQAVGQGDYEYLCGPWIDSLIDCLKEKGYASVANNNVTGGTFLVGFNGSLYRIDDDFQVGMRVDHYDSVGCGGRYAIGAMSMLIDDDISPEEKINKALAVAARFSAGVRGPFVVKKLSAGQGDIVPALVEILSKENND